MMLNDFITVYGDRIINIHGQGDFRLAVNESSILSQFGWPEYEIASIYELEAGNEVVFIENNTNPHPQKTGYLVLRNLIS